ncbi:hypothetical protein ILUMI_06036, partial [Ignelater luminosus]
GNLEERRYSSKPTDSVASTDVGTTSDQPKNPMEFFELIWTDELLNHIKAQTIQYATEINANSLFQISINEIRVSKKPVIEYLNKEFIEYTPPNENVTVDETIILYYRHHCYKQRIQENPKGLDLNFDLWTFFLRLSNLIREKVLASRRPWSTGIGSSYIC